MNVGLLLLKKGINAIPFLAKRDGIIY